MRRKRRYLGVIERIERDFLSVCYENIKGPLTILNEATTFL